MAIVVSLRGRQVLFVSYNGMLDPLGQSQVIPYLKELGRKGVKFYLLSFERGSALERASTNCESLRRELASHNIEWHWLRYHKTPSLLATAYDVLAGISSGQKLVKRHAVEMVHARSHIAATIALALKNRFDIKFLFDIRGLMAEEYVEAGHWRRGAIPYRLTTLMERRALRAADGVVTLTERIWPQIKNWDGLQSREILHSVVPCCADLDIFRFRSEDRARRRAELGLHERFVLVYSGSIGGWYLSEQMSDLFLALRQKRKDAYFLWLTTGQGALIEKLMADRGVSSADYKVLRVTPDEVPAYLSACDLGIAFYQPGFSKLATSPVKIAEYLACGLPFLINTGVGDSEFIVEREGVGALVSSFTAKSYSEAIERVEPLTERPEETRNWARCVAERFFDLRGIGGERYARLYEQILST